MKKILFAFIKRKNSIHSVQRDDVCEIGIFFTNNIIIGWCESGKATVNETLLSTM